MLRVYYKNDMQQPCTIRPTPLVSISPSILQSPNGEPIGVIYNITLTGTLIADLGSPYAIDQQGSIYGFYGGAPASLIGPYGSFDSDVSHFNNKPPKQIITQNQASHALFSKQASLRALFATPGQRLEISDIDDNEPTIICFPKLVGDVSFQEGILVDTCQFTINLQADVLLDKDLKVMAEGTMVPTINGVSLSEGVFETDLINDLKASFISDFNEDWSIETDEGLGESPANPRSYRITHSINATGRTHYGPSQNDPDVVEKYPAWLSAKSFVQRRLANGIDSYPNIMGQIGSGSLNLAESYGGFNHVRSEQVSESNGTYSVTETWLIASGTSYENYNLSVNTSIDSPLVSVSIDGTIRGLTSISPSGFGSTSGITAIQKAIDKYNLVTNSGQFGISSDIYKRANNAVAVQLNSQPRSIAIGRNDYAGEISYNLQFDNRPTNIISGVLAESISINDTYPGDIFAVVNIPGRKTGPILQYVGGRTEYKRDVSINIIMDYTKLPYGSNRNSLLLQKPSVMQPTAEQLAKLLGELSPANEPGVRKYFLSPPQESWTPKEGAYSISLSWVYELDK